MPLRLIWIKVECGRRIGLKTLKLTLVSHCNAASSVYDSHLPRLLLFTVGRVALLRIPLSGIRVVGLSSVKLRLG